MTLHTLKCIKKVGPILNGLSPQEKKCNKIHIEEACQMIHMPFLSLNSDTLSITLVSLKATYSCTMGLPGWPSG